MLDDEPVMRDNPVLAGVDSLRFCSAVRFSDGTFVPPPTDAQLDECETLLGHRFPASYRAFMTRFGPGRVFPAWTIRPITTTVGAEFAVPTVIERTTGEGEQVPNGPDIARYVHLAFNHNCEEYPCEMAFDTAEITQVEPLEYRLCMLYMGEWWPAYASFEGFLASLAEESWIRGDSDWVPEARGRILHEPVALVGKPAGPVTFEPEWRTSTVVSLAQRMYDDRDFGLMPVLADALQDAGCDNDDILNHCRGPGPHVRGC